MARMETCSDLEAGEVVVLCACGKVRSSKRAHGWRAPGARMEKTHGPGDDVPPPEDVETKAWTIEPLKSWNSAGSHEGSCGAVLECGGRCRFDAGHPPPCLCCGDDDGPGSCPA